MAGEGTKRIIDLTEAAETQSGDYIAIDSTGRGTRKLPAGFMATAEDLSEEQTERRTADATLDGKITAEAQARLDADNALGDQITALDEKTEADAALIQNPTKTLSGTLVSFTDGADMPMVACTAEIVPKQSGTGTPSPDNARPISGWESVETSVCGKNVLENASDSYSIANATHHPYTVKNLSSYSGKEMTFSIVTSDIKGKRIALYKNGDLIKVGTFGTKSVTATMPTFTDSDTLRLYLQDYTADAVAITGAQLELGTTATPYEPYTATTTTVNLGRTVYGGTLDVVSGVLTVDRAMVDMGSLNWAYYNNRFDARPSGVKVATGWNQIKAIASALGQATILPNETANDGCFGIYNGVLYVRYNSATTVAAFKTAMSGVQLVYELATPQTYTLTGQEVSTLLGDNNVWADSGDVEITYRRDISIVINNLESALNG